MGSDGLRWPPIASVLVSAQRAQQRRLPMGRGAETSQRHARLADWLAGGSATCLAVWPSGHQRIAGQGWASQIGCGGALSALSWSPFFRRRTRFQSQSRCKERDPLLLAPYPSGRSTLHAPSHAGHRKYIPSHSPSPHVPLSKLWFSPTRFPSASSTPVCIAHDLRLPLAPPC
jgi:hypothetical protein